MGEEHDKFKYETDHLNMASIAPENGKHTIGNSPWWFKMQLGILALSALLLLVGLVGIMIPYEPYTLYGWKGIPKEVCPNTELHTSNVSKVEEGPYTVDDVEGYAAIVNSGGAPVATWDIERDIDPYPKQTQPSTVVRITPEVRGMYKIKIDVDIHGRMFGIVPRYQEVEKTSKESFFVLSESDSRCREG